MLNVKFGRNGIITYNVDQGYFRKSVLQVFSYVTGFEYLLISVRTKVAKMTFSTFVYGWYIVKSMKHSLTGVKKALSYVREEQVPRNISWLYECSVTTALSSKYVTGK